MFLPHCHGIHTFFDITPCSLEDSLRLAAAFMVERELEEYRQSRFARPAFEREPEHIEEGKLEYIG